MSIAVITGSNGLIGSEATAHFCGLGLEVVGIDNDMRQRFFGAEASTGWKRLEMERQLGSAYRHADLDIRDREGLDRLLRSLGPEIELVIHTAAQPSHDWAAKDPFTDFDINAVGTINLLEAVRRHAPGAAFIHCSTNKVYGDRPNSLPFRELDTRYELAADHDYFDGIREDMSVDACLHSLFGASKLGADILVQEYARYFGLKTAVFRGGTLTGPAHSATELHGFLGYIMRCAITATEYTIYGYKGKQVRDAIHSRDLIAAFEAYFRSPRPAEVYNIGGGRASNASVLEAIAIAEQVSGNQIDTRYSEANRVGDHIWWIGSNARFMSHYPDWRVTYDVERILSEIHDAGQDRWSA